MCAMKQNRRTFAAIRRGNFVRRAQGRRAGRETEPFPRRVRHLQRKLNDSAQFARTRSVRRLPASPPYDRESQGSCRARARAPARRVPQGRLRPCLSVKILECGTRGKVYARGEIEERSVKAGSKLRFKRRAAMTTLSLLVDDVILFARPTTVTGKLSRRPVCKIETSY